jgi:hypothetical protein
MRTTRLLWFRPRVKVRALNDGESPFLALRNTGDE